MPFMATNTERNTVFCEKLKENGGVGFNASKVEYLLEYSFRINNSNNLNC